MFDGFDHGRLERLHLGHHVTPPPSLFGIGAVKVGNSIVVIGGRRDTACSNDVHSSTDGGRCFNIVPPSGSRKFCARSHFACVAVGRSLLYVIGGFNQDNQAMNDVWCSGDFGESWEEVLQNEFLLDDSSTTRFLNRGYLHGFETSDGGILVMGGTDLVDCFNDVWKSVDGGTTGAKRQQKHLTTYPYR